MGREWDGATGLKECILQKHKTQLDGTLEFQIFFALFLSPPFCFSYFALPLRDFSSFAQKKCLVTIRFFGPNETKHFMWQNRFGCECFKPEKNLSNNTQSVFIFLIPLILQREMLLIFVLFNNVYEIGENIILWTLGNSSL